MAPYPRDMRGYGRRGIDPKWPGGAKIALQFVVNYEEGGENNLLHGDAASEAFLSEIVGAQPWPGQRHWNMESIYEYGARAGFWRLYRMFTEREIPVTVYGVATALMRAPDQVAAMQEAEWEIASHGLKWIEHKDMDAEEEAAQIAEAIRLHEASTGARPIGWYTGRCSANTMDLVAEAGGFAYCSDVYSDDLPYWHESPSGPLLAIPYTLDTNDMRFAAAQGFNSGDQFYSYLKDAFDVLYAEGEAGAPKMLSIGLHCRLVGRPGRAAALARFVDYALAQDGVWATRRIDIAEHWAGTHPYTPKTRPSQMDRSALITAFGSVFEHSPWIADRAWERGLGAANDTAEGLHFALRNEFRLASEEERLGVLRAHPDLAGKLAAAKRLTAASTEEQAGAGLDALTDEERARFTDLNSSYTEKFGHPFIFAVKGFGKMDILKSFEARINNDAATELQTACKEVEKIALNRLKDLLPEA